MITAVERRYNEAAFVTKRPLDVSAILEVLYGARHLQLSDLYNVLSGSPPATNVFGCSVYGYMSI